jgi:NTP pyrophosphatase (non-canonical NTP hydrolase)
MNLQELGQSLLDEFELGVDPATRALDLSSEVGEACKEILKSTQYGTRDFQATPNLEMELGDAFFSLLTLASSVNVDLDAALENVVTKMRDRLERTGQLGSDS